MFSIIWKKNNIIFVSTILWLILLDVYLYITQLNSYIISNEYLNMIIEFKTLILFFIYFKIMLMLILILFFNKRYKNNILLLFFNITIYLFLVLFFLFWSYINFSLIPELFKLSEVNIWNFKISEQNNLSEKIKFIDNYLLKHDNSNSILNVFIVKTNYLNVSNYNSGSEFFTLNYFELDFLLSLKSNKEILKELELMKLNYLLNQWFDLETHIRNTSEYYNSIKILNTSLKMSKDIFDTLRNSFIIWLKFVLFVLFRSFL